MASTVVNDRVVWAKNVSGAPKLVDRILKMQEKETIALVIDGIPGIWEKMANGRDGRPTPGIKPVGTMKPVWGRLFDESRGVEVTIDFVEPDPIGGIRGGLQGGSAAVGLIEPPLARTEAEREAAWKAFLALASKGWRSDGPYGPRDELYER